MLYKLLISSVALTMIIFFWKIYNIVLKKYIIKNIYY